jgi:3-deoxy-D-manno-octulosonic-acid transferase
MYQLYSFLLVIWGFLLLPFFIYSSWRRRKHIDGLAQRFGTLPAHLRSDGRLTIWFHACSVGETLSLEPLVEEMHRRFPEIRFLFSTITATGQAVARQRFESYGAGNTFYFPVDLGSIAGRVLDWIRPAMLVIIDTEIWPNVLRQSCVRGIPVVLANGRISAESFRHYRRARPLLKHVFQNYRILMMQSEEDAARIVAMGAPRDKVVVGGNIKFDRDRIGKKEPEAIERGLQADFGLGELNAPLIVAGSTHPGEEEVLLDVLRSIRETSEFKQTRLLLAPRHPERFEEVAGLAARRGFKVRRRSGGAGHALDEEVFLLDTLGELSSAYRFATVAFVGGTLINHGGHSIMEPALHSKPIVIGPSMYNFRSIADEFRSRGALRQITAGPENRTMQKNQLQDVFLQLLQNPGERDALGRIASSILESNRGATRRISDTLASILEAQELSRIACRDGANEEGGRAGR